MYFNPNMCKLRFTYLIYLAHQARSNLSNIPKFYDFKDAYMCIDTCQALSMLTTGDSIQPRHQTTTLLPYQTIHISQDCFSATRTSQNMPNHLPTYPHLPSPINTYQYISQHILSLNTNLRVFQGGLRGVSRFLQGYLK